MHCIMGLPVVAPPGFLWRDERGWASCSWTLPLVTEWSTRPDCRARTISQVQGRRRRCGSWCSQGCNCHHITPHYTQRHITHIATLHTTPLQMIQTILYTTPRFWDCKSLRLLLMVQCTRSDPLTTTLITYILYCYVFTKILFCAASLSGNIQW